MFSIVFSYFSISDELIEIVFGVFCFYEWGKESMKGRNGGKWIFLHSFNVGILIALKTIKALKKGGKVEKPLKKTSKSVRNVQKLRNFEKKTL